MIQKKKQYLGRKEAMQKAANFCVYQERTQSEVKEKLIYEFGQTNDEADEIIAHLIEKDFINEERFAKALAGGKFRIKKWGRIKVEAELRSRGLSDYCIKQGMKEINDTDYYATLLNLLEKKKKEIIAKTDYELNQKLARYAIGKGYEGELVWQILKEIQ